MQIFVGPDPAPFLLLGHDILTKVVNDQGVVLILQVLPLQIELILGFRIQKLVPVAREVIFLTAVRKSYCMRAFIEPVPLFSRSKVLAEVIDDVLFDVPYAQKVNRSR